MEKQMKRFFILLLLINFANAQNIRVINHQNYILKKENYREYGDKGTLLHFYHDNSLTTPALSITLQRSFGDCGKKTYEKSSYEIQDSKLIYYSKWHGFSMNGYRKMVYSFEKNASHAVQIENTLTLDDHSDASALLHKKKKNEKESAQLEAYIKTIQSRYHAEFLPEDKAEILAREVEKALSQNMQKTWAKKSP